MQEERLTIEMLGSETASEFGERIILPPHSVTFKRNEVIYRLQRELLLTLYIQQNKKYINNISPTNQ